MLTVLWSVCIFLLHAAFVARAILRPHREPASRVAWVVVIVVLPGLGILAYLLLGETNIGRQRRDRLREVLKKLPNPGAAPGTADIECDPPVSDRYAPLFRVGYSVNGFEPIGGNRGQLMADSNSAIEAMIRDIDAAQQSVHLTFYIWLSDQNGIKMVEALIRAVGRKVQCRVMADGLGSRALIASKYWSDMREAGVQVATALPIGIPLFRWLQGRLDLRNHRKILVIDNHITYCGSQNCADPEFRVKPRYAPWVDAMIRFEGPIARQNQYLFASDWMSQVNEDLSGLLQEALRKVEPGFAAQVIGTGPTARYSAMPEVFETLMYSARRELVITTPYFVPDEAILAALCASARRGVETTIILPAKNDSWIVGAASRSYYRDLLAAGVQIFEYHGGLLHTKSLTLDGQITLIGSANLDRRSFELNYENNILFHDAQLTADMRQRQNDYLSKSSQVTPEFVEKWPITQRLLNNTVAMLGPVL